jgi:hypothetical protein
MFMPIKITVRNWPTMMPSTNVPIQGMKKGLRKVEITGNLEHLCSSACFAWIDTAGCVPQPVKPSPYPALLGAPRILRFLSLSGFDTFWGCFDVLAFVSTLFRPVSTLSPRISTLCRHSLTPASFAGQDRSLFTDHCAALFAFLIPNRFRHFLGLFRRFCLCFDTFLTRFDTFPSNVDTFSTLYPDHCTALFAFFISNRFRGIPSDLTPSSFPMHTNRWPS